MAEHKLYFRFVYPPEAQKMIDFCGDECDRIFERAKKEIRSRHLGPRECQRIQERVQREIKPYVDEIVRIKSQSIWTIELIKKDLEEQKDGGTNIEV